MNKTILFCLVLVLMVLSNIPFIISNPVKATPVNPSGGTIIGDSVIWENDWGRLEVHPHTSNSLITQTQYANLVWKLGDNNIDLAFRFDDPISNSDIWLWQNIPHEVKIVDYGEIPDSYTLYDITSFENLFDTPDIVDYGDTSSNYYYEGTDSNDTVYIIGFDSFEWLNPGHTEAVFYYSYYGATGSHTEQQYYYDWNSKKSMFEHTIHNDKHYYYISNLPVIQNVQYKFKWQYDIPIDSNGKWELLGKLHSDTIQEALDSGHYIMLDPWWNSNWGYKKEITIDHTQINSTLTNFPVLINIASDADLVAHVEQADGGDIAFVDSTETIQYNHEIELWDNTTGRLVAWVNVTSLSHTTDTTLFMYYGNSTCADQDNSDGTWNSDYQAVWHMNSSLNGSTSNSYNLTATGAVSTDTNGQIGDCQEIEEDYDGSSDNYIDSDDLFHDLAYNQTTFSGWVYNEAASAEYGGWLGSSLNTGQRAYIQCYTMVNYHSHLCWAADTTVVVYGDGNMAEWVYVTFRRDGENIYQFINGNLIDSNNDDNADTISGLTGWRIGPYRTTSWKNCFGGYVDEYRISNVSRSNDWINTEYNSMNNATDGGFFSVGEEIRSISVTTTAVTDIGYTSARLNGVLDVGVNATCGFWLGNSTTSSTSFWYNMTAYGVYNSSDTFFNNTGGLVSGKTYYVRAWGNDSKGFNMSTIEVTFDTLPAYPTSLTVTEYDDTNITLTWVKGADATVLFRNTTIPFNATTGTEVYNGTAQTFTDTGLTPDTHYYYRAYNWDDTWGFTYNNASTNEYTTPGKPLNVTSEVTVTGTSTLDLNISWVNGSGSDLTLIRRSSTTQPILPTDGTLVYNSSKNTTIDVSLSDVYYYTLWSYSNSSGHYSKGVNVSDFYIVWVNVYNESDPDTNVTDFSLIFSNSDGTDTYAEKNCNNPHIINVSDIPQGYNIVLVVNATGYEGRIYYLDISVTGNYFIDCYLAPTVAKGETTKLYTVKVIDTYQNAISDVKVTISRYRNETVGYVDVSSDYTGGYGEVTFYLIPESFYRVNLSKSGYTQAGSKYWVPDPIWYGVNYPKIFQMTIDSGDEINVFTGINYSIEPLATDHYADFTMYFNITSESNDLEWYKAVVYLWNNTLETWVVLYSETSTTSSGGSISYTTVNGTGRYALECSFKREDFDSFNFGTPHSDNKCIFNIWPSGGSGDTGLTLDEAITGNVGASPVYVGTVIVAYSSLIACFIAMILLFTFSAKFAGFAIIVAGIVIAAFKQPLGLIGDDVMNMGIAALIIILGLLTIYVAKKKG